jgi:outer membrane protein OmpA-like peptidoglycan-associated protein
MLVEQEKSELAAKFWKAKKGDLISIQNINFYLNSEKIYEKSAPLLEELNKILVDNPKLRIEIHGHICCNRNPFDTKLSSRRAIVIFKYLLTNGIALNRLAYKGIGSSQPIFAIPERTEMERAANRRVEILIVEK